MKLGWIILPDERWETSAGKWRQADELGFDSAWTYDHISWSPLKHRAWFSPFPVLTAAACATQRIRLGTLVTSPNFRHPLPVAKDAIAIDDISRGRFTLGIGAGATAGDAQVLDQRPLSARRRAQRFSEFVHLADRMLREQEITYEGDFYSVFGARMLPGCVQRPRAELAIAGAGRTALDLAARYGNAWVTWGPTDFSRKYTRDEIYSAVALQLDQLSIACEKAGRGVDDLDRIFAVTGFTDDRLETARSYLRLARQYAEIGITGLLIHWPRREMPYAADPALPRRIADEVLADIHKM